MQLKQTMVGSGGWWRVALAGGLLALLFLLAFWVVAPLDHANSDFFKFWLAAEMNWSGRNPYLAQDWVAGHAQFGATWLPEKTFLYPLPLAVLLAPLGLLPVPAAFVAWVFLSELMMVAALALFAASWRETSIGPFLVPIVAGIGLFRPVMVTLWSGQAGALFLLALALAIWCWERGRWWQGGALLALLLLKPTLGGPVVLLLGLCLLAQRHWAALGGLGGGGIALLLLGLARNPRWVVDFLAIGNNRLAQSFGYSPTVWGLGTLACGTDASCAVALGAPLAALLVVGCAYLLLQRRIALAPWLAVSCVITVALLITPYTWAYDQILLIIPVVGVMRTLAARGKPFVLIAVVFLAVDAVAIVGSSFVNRLGHDILSISVPVLVLALLLAVVLRARPAS